MGAIQEVFSFITSGSIAGLPPLVIMIIPFIIGIIVGYLVRKVLKIAIIAAIILIIVSYFGFFGLSLSTLKTAATTYGPMVVQYGALIIGVLPIGLGFIIGLVIGFILS
ncbi:MAG: hypothetical protein LBC12_07080 [Nitrososphaerota archaeon]|jgi:uncharacterized membrane protein (Fun14 family)|nr:hypothetical protein [Nitrososphaerota archaeon]